jgi:hypothetical protein
MRPMYTGYYDKSLRKFQFFEGFIAQASSVLKWSLFTAYLNISGQDS